MIVWHNPDLEEFAGYLICSEGRARLDVKKGTLAEVNCSGPLGRGRGALRGLWPARQLGLATEDLILR